MRRVTISQHLQSGTPCQALCWAHGMITSLSSQGSSESYCSYSQFTDEITQGQPAQGPTVVNQKVREGKPKSKDPIPHSPHWTVPHPTIMPAEREMSSQTQEHSLLPPPFSCRQVTEDNLAEMFPTKRFARVKRWLPCNCLLKGPSGEAGKHTSSSRWLRVERWLHVLLSDFNFPELQLYSPIKTSCGSSETA